MYIQTRFLLFTFSISLSFKSQVDLLTTYIIVGVATQGRQDYSQWVTSFKIACSIDSTTFDTVKDPTNTDTDNVGTNLLTLRP